MAITTRFTPGVNQDNTYRTVTQDYQTPAYATTLVITTGKQVTLVKVGQLTGAMSITIDTGDSIDPPFVGDTIRFLFSADSTGTHIVTFSTGFAASGTLSVATSKYGSAQFTFNGSIWVEDSVAATV
jgi:hypothetical protein